MDICKICGTPLQPGRIQTLATQTGDKCICDTCGTHVSAMLKREDPVAVAAARDYFEHCRLRATDPAVRDYLTRLCGRDVTGAGSLAAPKPKSPQADDWGAGTEKPASAGIGVGSLDASFWITCLKVTLGVTFGVIILAGVIYAFASGMFGLLVLIAALLLATAAISGGMVLLNVAQDVSAIRHWIVNNPSSQLREQANESEHTNET